MRINTSYLFFSSVARRGSPPFIKAASVRSRMDALVTVSHLTVMIAIWEERWHVCGGSDLHHSKSKKSQFSLLSVKLPDSYDEGSKFTAVLGCYFINSLSQSGMYASN